VSRRRAIVLGVTILLIAGLLWWRSGEGTDKRHYYSPDEYVERADHFIEAGYLTADCSGSAPRLVAHLDDAPVAESAWYGESYLADDVARFNEEPGSYAWTFSIDQDCILRGVNPVVHRVSLPFARRIQWLGSIFYGGPGSDAALRSARRVISLRHPAEPIPAQEEGRTEVGRGGDLSQEGVVLLHYAGGPGWPAARVYHVGPEAVVLHNRSRPELRQVARLMGHRLPVGRIVALETGDWIHLADDAPAPREETFVFVGGETLDAASTVRLRNDHHERVTDDAGLGRIPDPARDETDPYLELLARSIDSALDALPERRARELAAGFDLQITVERSLQEELSELLRRRVRELQGTGRSAGRPFPAGITVMDGKTGRLLALATSPWEEDLEGAQGIDAPLRRRLLQNQNLILHPIGSAGKPFFFAAIADAHPFLLDLEIAEHPPEQRHRLLFQCELPTGYQLLAGHFGRIGFRRALEISCNKFTVELATLALAARRTEERSAPLPEVLPRAPGVIWPLPGRSSGLLVAGRPVDYAPALGQHVLYRPEPPRERDSGAAFRCDSLDRLELVPFRAPLEEVTGAATYRGRTPPRLPEDATERLLHRSYTTNRYDLRPWAPLLAHLMTGTSDAAAWSIRTATQGVSPERVDLAFNQVSLLREEWVSLLLGGATSTWTNIQLAEALSRLVTGRAVQARLAKRVIGRGGEEEPAVEEVEDATEQAPPLLDLRPEARESVLQGLAAVVDGPEGTAKELRDELAGLRADHPEDRILLYSKTGSPIILHPVPATVGEALAALVARGRLSLEGREMLARPGGQAAPHRGRNEPGRQTFLEALSRGLGEVGYGREGGWLFRELASAVDDLAEELASSRPDSWAEIEGPLVIRQGRLRVDRRDDLFRRGLRKGKGSVYIFTLVRLPGAAGTTGVPTPEELAQPDTRIVTAAIYLATGPDSRVAVQTAQAALRRISALLR
jgi:hypothetical protein